ncbi:MAG: hypothetical protein JWO05_3811 [Gemmatimonadetes bacterium]|nr:hypothetical protein [Gemmatimonadota bacterium]
MSMPRVALVTWGGLPGLSADDQRAAAALRARGARVDAVAWDDALVPWTAYEAIVVRSAWDYHTRPEQFRAWIARVAPLGTLWNPAAVLQWNMDKRYLLELASRGVRTVPTVCVDATDGRTLAALLDEHAWGEVVIKPAISASGNATWRSSREHGAADEARFRAARMAGAVLVQPFQPEVMTGGEWSLVHIRGEFSHAVVKRARAGEFRVQEEHGGTASVETPSEAMLAAAKQVLSRVEGRWLYARVDGCMVGGEFTLMELELIEPSLYLGMAEGAAERLAEGITQSC